MFFHLFLFYFIFCRNFCVRWKCLWLQKSTSVKMSVSQEKSPSSWRSMCSSLDFVCSTFRELLSFSPLFSIMKTRLFKYIENFTFKNRKFSDKKNFDIFSYFCSKYIVCGYSLEPLRRGGSIEYPQSIFLSRNKKNNVYPCKPQSYYITVRFKGVKII